MANIHQSITELVGHTPLVELKNYEKSLGLKAHLLGKLEYFNPSGSVKDRAALNMILEAEKDGRLKPGGKILDFTSGNTGIATAAFANASGLEKEGDNLYSATLNSGEFDGIGVDITAGGGYMSTGQLEMSNVDLSSEFTEMITTQRGFQANSRIITVSDTLLEELTNLKR